MTQDASIVPSPNEEWAREQLRSLPDPVMPADVVARLSAALKAEQDGGPVESKSRRGWLTGLAVAASAAMGLMLLAWTPWQTQPDNYERVVALTSVKPVSSATNYTAANIAQAVDANLSSLTARGNELPLASESQRRGSFAANDEVMASCLDGLGTAADDVRLVDLADYQGQPSGIVVFSDDGGNLVVVVAPRCGRDDPGVRMRVAMQPLGLQP